MTKMKKTAALILSVISVILFPGCANADAPFAEKSYEADGSQITEITLEVRDRQIEVLPSKDSQIHIGYFESSEEYFDISVSDDHVLTMQAKTNKKWTDYFGSKPDADSRKITLQIPDDLLSVLTLKTTNEDILLSPLTVKNNISLFTNNGNITFDKINAGSTLNLTAKNGNISGTILGSYDDFSIACKIKKGESNLPASKDNGAKTLNVSANNGNINIDFVKN